MRYGQGQWQRWSAAAVSRRRALGIGAGVAGASALALACGGGGKKDEGGEKAPQAAATAAPVAPDQPRPGGSVRVRMSGTPPLDPFTNTTFRAQTMAGYVYSRLLRFKTGADPAVAYNYEVQGDLAASYELADEGRQITFKLQPNAVFHNKAPVSGRTVDSEDVKISLDRFRTEPKNSNRAVFGTPESPLIEKVETPDPKTVVVKLAKPSAPILNMFANPQYLWIMPRESGSGFDPAKDQIGSGPWVMESLQPDVEIKLKANRSYFVKDRPWVDSFTIAIILENVAAKSQIQAERLDMDAITYEDKAEVESTNPKLKLVSYIPTTTPFIAFQLRKDSPFKDERVRRAVSMAFDRDALLQLSFDGQGVYHNMVPAWLGKWWLDPKSADMGDSAKYFKHDVREAKAMIQAAGAAGTQMKFIYTNNAYGERFNQWAETVAIMMKDIGLSPTIVVQDYAREYISANGTFFGNFEGMFFGLQTPLTDPQDLLFNMCHSKSTRNHGGVKDDQLDSMLDRAATTMDEPTRVKLTRDIQRYLGDKMYYVPGFTGPAFTGVQPWIKGYRFSATYGVGTEAYSEVWVDRG